MSPLPAAVRLEGGVALCGHLRVPGDKSISHRALLLGAMAEGVSVVRGLSGGDDVARTARAVEQLGAQVTVPAAGVTEIRGGRKRWHPLDGPIDCGNSGTSMRLLAGALAPCPWTSVLTGDASLRRRPMDRIADPLRAMGARIEGLGSSVLPPLTLTGSTLHGVEWIPPVASAQVKSAILLAGIEADGTTTVREAVPTRTHTEELLEAAAADITVFPWGSGRAVSVRRSTLRAFSLEVPGDPSQAAFWVVAGAIVPGSELTITHLYTGAERLGFLDVLGRMGVEIERTQRGGVLEVSVRSGALRATTVHASEVPSLDEVPVLAVAAASAEGTTEFLSMSELRVKESDRLAAVCRLVDGLGARAEIVGEDLRVTGLGGPLAGGHLDCAGDHRIAMAATVGALAAYGPTTITDFSAVETSYPTFLDDLTRIAGNVWEPAREDR